MVKIETRMGGGSGGGASTGEERKDFSAMFSGGAGGTTGATGYGASPNYMSILGKGLESAGSTDPYSPPAMPELNSQFQQLTIPTGDAAGLIPTNQSQSLDIDAIIRLLTGK